MTKKTAASWSKSHWYRSTPTTKATKASTTVRSTATCRAPAPVTGTGAGLEAGVGPRVRRAYSIVPPIQIVTAGTRMARRNSQPERRSSRATFWAMPTWKGLMGLNDAPTAEALVKQFAEVVIAPRVEVL